MNINVGADNIALTLRYGAPNFKTLNVCPDTAPAYCTSKMQSLDVVKSPGVLGVLHQASMHVLWLFLLLHPTFVSVKLSVDVLISF